MEDKICPNCRIKHNNRGTCHDKKCGYEYRKRQNTIWKKCPWCGKMFPTELGRINCGRGIYDSVTCQHLAWLKDTPNRSKKISASLQGREITWGDKISQTLIGTTMPEVTKRKISTTLLKTYQDHPEIIEKTIHYGPSNGMFNNYSSYIPYTEEFNERRKDECRSMYDYLCRVCHKTTEENRRELDVHHIDYNKDNSDLSNLYPLCTKCHNKTKPPNFIIRWVWYIYFTSLKRSELMSSQG